MLIRQPKAADAASYLRLQAQLAQQSNFLLLTPAEAAAMSLAEYQEFFNNMASGATLQRVLIAEIHGTLAGYMGFSFTGMAKAKHIVSRVAVGVEKTFQRQGVASALFAEAEKLWQAMQISRVEFTVITENQPAIKLYTKLGYQIEGERKHSVLKSAGTFYHEYYLAKHLQ